MSSNYYQKRRKPNNYFRSNKKQKEFVLKAGLKGFLCTCNAREGDCIREAYNILNEYADKLPPLGNLENESEDATADEHAAGSCKDDPEDIDAALEKELCSLKEEANKKPGQRKFQVVESGAKNCLFIQTTVAEPVELVLSILEDLNNTKEQKCRFLQRLLPIEATCRATIEDVRATLEPLLDKYLAKESKTFAIMFTRRNSSALNRDEVIENLAEMVSLKNTGNRADLKSPQLSIMVEVVRGICCLAILPDYYKFKKYNLLELIAPEKSVDDSVDSGTQGDGTHSTEADDDSEPIGGAKESNGTQSEGGVCIDLKEDDVNVSTSKDEYDSSEACETQKSIL